MSTDINRFLGKVIEAVAATSGTIAVTKCRVANIQAVMDGSGYDVALLPSTSAAATCSKNSCAAVISNLGTYEARMRNSNYYIAYRVYNGATAATGATGDNLIVERLG